MSLVRGREGGEERRGGEGMRQWVGEGGEGEVVGEEGGGAIWKGRSYHISCPFPDQPFIAVHPLPQQLAEGETLRLLCAAGGYPIPTIRWLFNGEQVRHMLHTGSQPGWQMATPSSSIAGYLGMIGL